MRCISLLSLSVVCVCLPALLCAADQAGELEQIGELKQIAVIVPQTHTAETVSQAELARIYQRRQRFWSNGAKIVPFNLMADHPVRHQFSLHIFNRLPEDMRDYWNTQYFQGVSPPYALASAEAVIQFVASTPGAIGYVPARLVNGHVEVPRQVKILMLLPASPRP